MIVKKVHYVSDIRDPNAIVINLFAKIVSIGKPDASNQEVPRLGPIVSAQQNGAVTQIEAFPPSGGPRPPPLSSHSCKCDRLPQREGEERS